MANEEELKVESELKKEDNPKVEAESKVEDVPKVGTGSKVETESKVKDVSKTEDATTVVEDGDDKVAEPVLDTVTEDAAKDEDGVKVKTSSEISDHAGWKPKTVLGKLVKEGKITDIDSILDSGKKILEQEIIDILLPNMETELLLIGQSKGKFGGGQRRVFRQTQKKTREGNKPQFSTIAVVGNRDGYVGIGYGKAKETVPAREKAFRRAKLNIFKIRRGAGSWEDAAKEAHSIPFAVRGKCGSVELTLLPAPKGTGLCIEKECAKILSLAGIQNVWSKSLGKTKTKFNTIVACEQALKSLMKMKLDAESAKKLCVVEGLSGETKE